MLWTPPPGINLTCRICGSSKVIIEKGDGLEIDRWGDVKGVWHCDSGHRNEE
jgi:hypothetical protein